MANLNLDANLDTNKPIYLLKVEDIEKLKLVLKATAKKGFKIHRKEDFDLSYHFTFIFVSPEQNLCGFCTNRSIVWSVGKELQPGEFFKKFKIQINVSMKTPL